MLMKKPDIFLMYKKFIYLYYVFLFTYSDMDRPKRVAPKPVRYQTTSSDESPRKQRRSIAEATITEQDIINKDIDDISRELTQSPTNSIINTCLRQPHTQQYTEQQYTPQCTNTNIQAHSKISTHTRYTPKTQAYENTHAQTLSTIQQHTHNAQKDFTLVTDGGSDKSYYINNTLSEFQTSAETWSRQQQDSSRHHHRDEYVGYHLQGIPYQKQFNEKRYPHFYLLVQYFTY